MGLFLWLEINGLFINYLRVWLFWHPCCTFEREPSFIPYFYLLILHYITSALHFHSWSVRCCRITTQMQTEKQKERISQNKVQDSTGKKDTLWGQTDIMTKHTDTQMRHRWKQSGKMPNHEYNFRQGTREGLTKSNRKWQTRYTRQLNTKESCGRLKVTNSGPMSATTRSCCCLQSSFGESKQQ